MRDDTIKRSLSDLSESIKANQQALDNAVLDIIYLEKLTEQLSNQIQHAYRLPNGEWLDLEGLCTEYHRLRQISEELGSSYVG